MKSDNWLTEKIIKESLNKQDISHIRKLIQEGKSDDEVLLSLRKIMFSNSKGLRAYIRHEKLRALMLKLSYRIHWIYLLPVIKRWLKEKEVLIRWKESKHCDKIQKKTNELKKRLLDIRNNKVKFNCISMGDIPEDVMYMIEEAAEELLLQIEKEETDGSLKSKENIKSFINTQNKTTQLNIIRKEKREEAPGKINLNNEPMNSRTIIVSKLRNFETKHLNR